MSADLASQNKALKDPGQLYIGKTGRHNQNMTKIISSKKSFVLGSESANFKGVPGSEKSSFVYWGKSGKVFGKSQIARPKASS